MDTVRGLDDPIEHGQDELLDDHGQDSPVDIGSDERRMHVRAYNHWVSLLNGRPFPLISDLEPENIADFGPNSVLIDFSHGLDDPTIQFLGSLLREECGITGDLQRIADVPSRSLLSRLTDHYLQIIANRAPIGFEAEFVSQRGYNTFYRGILMPFSSTGEAIDFIYGVINWKEVLDDAAQAVIHAALDAVRQSGPRSNMSAPIWADGPGAGLGEDADSDEDDALLLGAELEAPFEVAGLADQLVLARETAELARVADTRSRAALYRALGRAHDFALATLDSPEDYAELLADAGITVQARAPMTAVVKLVFGGDYDKARVTEFAAVLAYARRTGLAAGQLVAAIEAMPGGMKAMVQAERAHRRPAPRAAAEAELMTALRARPTIASVPIAADGAEFVLLLARANDAGALDVVGRVDADEKLTRQAVRHLAE